MSDNAKKSSAKKAAEAGLRTGIMGVGAALAAGHDPIAAGILAASAGAAGSLLDVAISRAPERLASIMEGLFVRRLEKDEDAIKAKVEELVETVGEEEAVEAIIPNLSAYAKAQASADRKKERILMAALVSAFDPDSYRAGMTRRFFSILEELDYPEIRELAVTARECRASWESLRARGNDSNLEEHTLAPDGHDSGRITHRARLKDHGLVKSASTFYGLTWLGIQLVEFLERGGFNEADENGGGKE